MFQTPKTQEFVVIPRSIYTASLRDFKPLRDGLLCRRLPMPQGSTASDLIEVPIIAQKAVSLGQFLRTENKSIRGEVIRVGPGRVTVDGGRIPMEVRPGDIVWWGQYIDFEDEESGLVVISEKDVRFVECHA